MTEHKRYASHFTAPSQPTSTHLDIGYTDPQQIVLEQHMRYLDATLELATNREFFTAVEARVGDSLDE
jgi:hypothetical protein